MSLRKGTILISGVSGSSQSETIVDTYENLPTSNVSEFTRAYVRYPSLYDVTTIAELEYDITQMHDCSPLAEPDYSTLQENDTFTINYLDIFNRGFIISLVFVDGNGVLFFGYEDSMEGSATNKTPVFVHTSSNIQGIGFSAGWNFLDAETQVGVGINFNDVPLIPAHLMTVSSTDGNPLLTNNFFVDCKKHWAGEYRYINGMWRYQQTPVSPYFETNLERVPSSTVLYETIQGASQGITTQLSTMTSVLMDLGARVQALENEIHGGGE